MSRERYSRIAQPGDCKMGFQPADHDGWLLLDGRTVHRTDVPMLFAKLAITDEAWTFPDFRGRSPVGAGGEIEIGELGGGLRIVLKIEHIPSHDHGYVDTVMTTGKAGLLAGLLQVVTANTPQANKQVTGKTGEGKPVDLPMQPYVGMSFFVYSGRRS